MAMNDYNTTGLPQGGSTWAPDYGGGGGGYSDYGGDINPQGAGADPFAYTGGSLLTPWSGRFNSGGYGGGYSVPEFTPFNYADFYYGQPNVGSFTEQYQDPATFGFADFAGPQGFKAPTAEDMKMDPGYQARMDAVKNAQVAGAAHGGVLRSGGFQKGLAQAVGNQASQEYGNVYNRRASEHDRARREAEGTYGINQGNTKSAFDTNVGNRLNAYQTRQGTWRDNANVGLQQAELGYNVAQGTWDRNMAKARQGYDDAQAHAAQVAAASAANAGMGYERDLADYNRARDEFWTNQDRQYAILDREANRGYDAATRYGDAMMGVYGGMGNNAVAAGDARAAGRQGSANAWGDAMGTIGGLGLYGAEQYNSQARPPSTPPIGGGRVAPMPTNQGAPFRNAGSSYYQNMLPSTYSGMPRINPNQGYG